MAGLDVVTRRTVYTRHVCLAAAHGPFREMSRASRLAYDTDDDDVDDDIDGGKGVARRRFDDDEEDGQDVIASESDEEIDRAARQKKRVRFAGYSASLLPLRVPVRLTSAVPAEAKGTRSLKGKRIRHRHQTGSNRFT